MEGGGGGDGGGGVERGRIEGGLEWRVGGGDGGGGWSEVELRVGWSGGWVGLGMGQG